MGKPSQHAVQTAVMERLLRARGFQLPSRDNRRQLSTQAQELLNDLSSCGCLRYAALMLSTSLTFNGDPFTVAL